MAYNSITRPTRKGSFMGKFFNMNSLGYMHDNEITNLYYALSRKQSNEFKKNNRLNTKELEESICYVQRELEIREQRREAHREYLKNLKRF